MCKILRSFCLFFLLHERGNGKSMRHGDLSIVSRCILYSWVDNSFTANRKGITTEVVVSQSTQILFTFKVRLLGASLACSTKAKCFGGRSIAASRDGTY